jgi:hypothetical protein
VNSIRWSEPTSPLRIAPVLCGSVLVSTLPRSWRVFDPSIPRPRLLPTISRAPFPPTISRAPFFPTIAERGRSWRRSPIQQPAQTRSREAGWQHGMWVGGFLRFEHRRRTAMAARNGSEAAASPDLSTGADDESGSRDGGGGGGSGR